MKEWGETLVSNSLSIIRYFLVKKKISLLTQVSNLLLLVFGAILIQQEFVILGPPWQELTHSGEKSESIPETITLENRKLLANEQGNAKGTHAGAQQTQVLVGCPGGWKAGG